MTQEVTVIGGGYSGLIQAYYLVQVGIPTRIVEKEKRLGGLLGSENREGFIIEQAANAFIANAELERVATQIGVKLIEKNMMARRRFICRGGEMKRWPLGLRESFPLVQFFIARKWKNPKFKPKSHETLYDWSFRNLGKSLTQYLIEPGIQGIYAASSDQLSAKLVLESLFKKQKKGKLVGSVSPQKGMQEWLDKMQEYLKDKGVRFELEKEAGEFDLTQPHIFAVGLSRLRNLYNEQRIPLHQSVLRTQSASLTSVTLCYKDQGQRLNEGFGCLFPKKEKFNALGVLFNHSIFAGRVDHGSSETWILNDQVKEFSTMEPNEVMSYVASDRSHFKPWTEPDLFKVSQWPDRIPLYNENLETFILEQEKIPSPFLLVGNYLGDLGLSKILLRAKDNVKKIQEGYFG